ncbi:MAG: GIY-YIG nuclease family protein [Elusimicrobia bacterium]|nr:GIY-YIG nuclease family protein [Elusimicrobiota bacterium]
MLEGLVADAGPREWSVYILRCGDGSYYTGIAKDVEARLSQHQAGKGAAYTKTHLPVALAYREDRFTRSGALIREAAIKSLGRPGKDLLVEGDAGRTRARKIKGAKHRVAGRRPRGSSGGAIGA